MRPERLDGPTADRLLSGFVDPDDAPPGYHSVARLLSDAAGGGTPEAAPAAEAATVAAMQAAVLGGPVGVSGPEGRTTMRSKLLPVKVAGAAAALVLAGGTAAAATDALPGPMQNTAAHVLSTIGINVPNGGAGAQANFGRCNAASHNGGSHGHASFPSSSACDGVTQPGGTTGDSGTGPNSHALFGLCTAASHHSKTPGKATVFPSSTVCNTVVHPGSQNGTDGTDDTGTSEPAEGSESGPPTSTPASGTAPVPTPDEGTTGTSAGSTDGTDHATTTSVVGHAVVGR